MLPAIKGEDMSYEIKIHEAQIAILRELLFHPSAGYAELQKPTGLSSDHFNFHISRLVELGYVEKPRKGHYKLSQKGKEHANKLDTDAHTIERQPKVSVVLIVQNNEVPTKYLVQQRLKNPYYGFWGRLGGKVRWGETFEDAARREFKEETGLDGIFRFRVMCRKLDYKKRTKELLEDKVFIIMEAISYSGTMVEQFEGGRNAWMTQDDLLKQTKRFETAYEFVDLLKKNEVYVTREFEYDDSEY